MGLTLNTNSLTVASSGGGASGVSTSDVTTLIKSNTRWQFITELTADASSEFEFTSIPSNFHTIRIHYKDLTFSQNSAADMRLYLDGTLETANSYRTAGRASTNSSRTNLYNTYTYWRPVDGFESGGQRHIMGFTDIGGNKVNSQCQMYSRISSVHSTSPTNYDFSGHLDTGHLKMITGFKLYPASGNWARGSIKIYGMN